MLSSGLIYWIVIISSLDISMVTGDDRHDGHYVNEWAVRIPGGHEHVQLVAREYGYENMGQVMGFEDIYLLQKRDVPIRSKREASHHTNSLKGDFRVEWAEQQVAKRRDKRNLHHSLNRMKQAVSRKRSGQTTDPNDNNRFNDPQYPNMWYLHDTRKFCSQPQLDMNVVGAWEMGYTGKGVVVSILDDGQLRTTGHLKSASSGGGASERARDQHRVEHPSQFFGRICLEWNHTDIYRNFDPYASFDVNGNDSDPFPRYDNKGTNKHGTRCAGEVSMIANNNKCGVGVAYDAKIGGVRLLDGQVTDRVEAISVGFNCSHVCIYSASWGPTDNGESLDGPGKLTRAAMERCIKQGRGGLGSLYIWASGNGGGKGDNCDCDGYTSSIYTISIGSVSQYGKFPWYGEMCASTMACTNSGGALMDQKISTIDLENSCTDDHSGTSAAAPLAAGAFALVLEANPKLGWRDCQHLLICTAEAHELMANPGWQTNGIGLQYNQRFGFGAMNVERMVIAAKNWVNVGQKTICTVDANPSSNYELISQSRLDVEFDVSRCVGKDQRGVNFLEHVQITLDMTYSRRGAVDIQLISPNGTQSQILNQRVADNSGRGFKQWTFLTLHMWGENPRGKWRLIISDYTRESNRGFLNQATLTLHGTQEIPTYRRTGSKCGEPRKPPSQRSCQNGFTVDNELMKLMSRFSRRHGRK